MTLTERQKKLLRWIGYPALAVVTFVYAAWLTFPADRLEERLMTALNEKADVDVEDFSLSWLPGKVTATNVVVRTRPKKKDEQPRTVIIDELDVGIGLLPLITGTISVDIRAQSGDGVIDGTVEKSGEDLMFSAETEDMPIKMMPGLNVVFAGLPANQGTLDAKVRLELPEGKWSLANGELDLACTECSVGPGKVKPTARPGRKLNAFKAQGITLPELQLGNATAIMEIEEGRGTLRDFTAGSTDGELFAEGYMDFKDPVALSELNFCARFKFTDEVKKKNPKLAAMETGLEKARRDDGYIGMRLSRTVERPRRKGSRDCQPGKEPSPSNSNAGRTRSRPRPSAPRTAAKPALPPTAGAPADPLADGQRDDGGEPADDDQPAIPPPATAPARLINPETAARLGRSAAGTTPNVDDEDGDDEVGEGVDEDQAGDGDGDYDDDEGTAEDADGAEGAEGDDGGEFDEPVIE